MHEERPSLTAIAVSLLRGVAPSPLLPGQTVDPHAHRALPPTAGRIARWLTPLMRVGPIEWVWRHAWAGLSSHVVLRTLAIDDAVREALRDGCTELIVLGAGFDTRSVRLPELASVPVLEVDHPATQAVKHGRLPDSHSQYVAVDFTRDDLRVRLREAGVTTTAPAVVVWEGVTPYLPHDATAATLRALGEVLAPGSVLLVTFSLPELMSLMQRHGWLAHRLFHWIGEPLAGAITEDQLRTLVSDAGFNPRSSSGTRDWAPRYGRPVPANVIEERVLVAVRAGGPP